MELRSIQTDAIPDLEAGNESKLESNSPTVISLEEGNPTSPLKRLAPFLIFCDTPEKHLPIDLEITVTSIQKDEKNNLEIQADFQLKLPIREEIANSESREALPGLKDAAKDFLTNLHFKINGEYLKLSDTHFKIKLEKVGDKYNYSLQGEFVRTIVGKVNGDYFPFNTAEYALSLKLHAQDPIKLDCESCCPNQLINFHYNYLGNGISKKDHLAILPVFKKEQAYLDFQTHAQFADKPLEFPGAQPETDQIMIHFYLQDYQLKNISHLVLPGFIIHHFVDLSSDTELLFLTLAFTCLITSGVNSAVLIRLGLGVVFIVVLLAVIYSERYELMMKISSAFGLIYVVLMYYLQQHSIPRSCMTVGDLIKGSKGGSRSSGGGSRSS